MISHRGLLHHLIINISDLQQSSRFYSRVFSYLGYQLAGKSQRYEDWKRTDLPTPHEISIVQVAQDKKLVPYVRGAVGHHDHLVFCALNREDVDAFYEDVLVPLQADGLCRIEDAPCDCPEYNAGYYATFFFDPDGLKYEYVFNPAHQMSEP